MNDIPEENYERAFGKDGINTMIDYAIKNKIEPLQCEECGGKFYLFVKTKEQMNAIHKYWSLPQNQRINNCKLHQLFDGVSVLLEN